MKPQLRVAAVAAALSIPMAAVADAVLDWNQAGVAAVLATRQAPPEGARAMAMMHLAQFDAANAIERRFASFGGARLAAPAGASAESAAGAAARAVLAKLFPDQQEALDKAWQAQLDQFLKASGVEAGIALGEKAAAQCLEMRANDGVGAPSLYKPVTTAGVYVPTMLPASYDWREVKPWLMKQPSQFRPDAPPALSSATWARDYNEIKDYGARAGSKRSAEQTEVARFWAAVGVATWNPVVRPLASAPGRSLAQNARLFALVNMAAADAFVAVFDAKYAYNLWRPVTAIRNGEMDGNDATAPDRAWLPLIDTPMHPEYPCAHCISSATVGAVLESEFGTGKVVPVAMTSPTLPGVTRRFEKISDYVTEVSNARIWAGVHYRNSTEVGQRMGREIGKLASAQMAPAH